MGWLALLAGFHGIGSVLSCPFSGTAAAVLFGALHRQQKHHSNLGDEGMVGRAGYHDDHDGYDTT
jgi:hypothetical protein